MRFLYYSPFAIPAIIFIVLLQTPDPFALNRGPALAYQLKLLEAIAIFSPILTIAGLVVVARSLMRRELALEPILATLIALVPGLIVLVSIHPHH